MTAKQGSPCPVPPRHRSTGKFTNRSTERLQIRGLVLLALILVLIALLRANWHALFAPGWWRVL